MMAVILVLLEETEVQSDLPKVTQLRVVSLAWKHRSKYARMSIQHRLL